MGILEGAHDWWRCTEPIFASDRQRFEMRNMFITAAGRVRRASSAHAVNSLDQRLLSTDVAVSRPARLSKEG